MVVEGPKGFPGGPMIFSEFLQFLYRERGLYRSLSRKFPKFSIELLVGPSKGTYKTVYF